MLSIIINGIKVAVKDNETILEAARRADIYIPTLCHHPDLPPKKGGKTVGSIFQGTTKIVNYGASSNTSLESGCGLCTVQLEDSQELVGSCVTPVIDGMKIQTETKAVKQLREEKLSEILADHPHACLTCAQSEGCSRSQCSSNVPEKERCCPQFGNCELQKVSEYIGIAVSTPKCSPTDLPILDSDPLIKRNYNLCIGCTRCVRACRDLRKVEALGFVLHEKGKVKVGSVAPTLKESGCKFCGACVEVCPTGAIIDKGIRSSSRQEDLLPCVAACPAGINIPWQLRLLAEGRADEALAVIRESVPFPGILGRVCIKPCESACRRGSLNEPVSICALKRWASDHDGGESWKNRLTKSPNSGKKVAVVGSGPAGLTVAYYLRIKGHEVTIFDCNPRPGGMMRYGIPRYRLPDHVIEQEINDILSLGIEIKTNMAFGRDFDLDDLRNQKFDAVFLGVGRQKGARLAIAGENASGVIQGVDFLRDIALGKKFEGIKRAVVIGGGNVATDAARTLVRLGAESTILYRRSRAEMPVYEEELRSAIEEGVKIDFFTALVEIRELEGKVSGIKVIHTELGAPDQDGRRRPVPVLGSEYILNVDTVIPAIGQIIDSNLWDSADMLRQTRKNTIKCDEITLATSIKGVFAGGDAVSLRGSIIEAVATGKRAAAAMDSFMGGDGNINFKLIDLPPLNPRLGRDEGFGVRSRLEASKITAQRRNSFDEVDLGFRDDRAKIEAGRCLQCDLRLAMRQIVLPPEHVMTFTRENVEKVPDSEGAFRLMDQEKMVILIKGVDNMRESLTEYLEDYKDARFFDYEEDKMFSKRESELIQKHLQKYGQMPSAKSEVDDFF
jgi:NADPH-dependent glutamate synthase beta subunit-like oxidoreductase/Na+-translocating ferredoxin:NAD+ oxidoreductase RNF subunit RnfB